MAEQWKRDPKVQARMDAVAHPTLPIQVPWTFEVDKVDSTRAEIWAPGNATPWRFAQIQGPDRESVAAYARLIAAAPDLLAALELIEPVWAQVLANRHGGEPSEMREPILNAIRSVIAKARGDQ